MTKRKKERGIQILRIVACFAVFICHFGQRLHIRTISINLYELTQLGQYGVELFFVISGYLACFSLNNGKSVIEFYKKRIVRILPLYYFCIIYYFITETFIFKDVPADPLHLGWLRYIFCLNGIVPSEGYFWSNIGITWTIPVFMMFYLLAPVIIKLAKSTFVSSVMTLFSFIVAYVVNNYLNGWMSSLIYLPCFMLGVLIYNAKKENLRFYTAIGLQLFVLILKYCDWSHYASKIIENTWLWGISAIFASIILISDELIFKKQKAIKTIEVLDEHSYTLYLIHGITFCGIVDKVDINVFSNRIIGIVFRLIITIIGTGVLTVIIHKYIEKPIQHALSKVLLRK